MSVPAAPFRFVSTDRRVREDRRFVVGKGRFAADVALPGTQARGAGDVSASGRAHRRDRQDRGAAPSRRALRARRARACRRDAAAAAGLDTPNVPRRPLAVDVARYAGEWVAAVVADTRALAEDAAEAVVVEYEPLPFVLDGEEAYRPGSPLVHAAHGSNVLLDRTFVWGEVEKDFADSPHHLSLKVKWGRSSTVPIETFGVTASWDPWREILDVWASMQMPRYPDQIAAGAEAAGLGGARAQRRRRRRQLRRQARHQAHGAGRLSVAPARLPGAADRGSAGEHARRRRARARSATSISRSPSTTPASSAR